MRPSRRHGPPPADADDFQRWLGQELGRQLGPVTRIVARPAQARYANAARAGSRVLPGFRHLLGGGLVALVASKGMVALAAGVVAAAAVGEIAGTAATGNPDPLSWAHRVNPKLDCHAGQGPSTALCVRSSTSPAGQAPQAHAVTLPHPAAPALASHPPAQEPGRAVSEGAAASPGPGQPTPTPQPEQANPSSAGPGGQTHPNSSPQGPPARSP